MGDVARALLLKMCAEATIQAVGNLMETSQLLGGLANAVMEEDIEEVINPNQLVEAAARCLDTIELIVEAARPPEYELNHWESTDLHREVSETKEALSKIRQNLLDLTKEEDGHTDVPADA